MQNDNLLGVRIIAEFMDSKHLNNFSYSTSWDELIPVVKKIQKLQVEDFTKKKPIIHALMDLEIESLYNSVVVFLQWWSKADK